jgi:hypothetical protein
MSTLEDHLFGEAERALSDLKNRGLLSQQGYQSIQDTLR